MVRVGVMTLGHEHKYPCEVGISVECTDTLDHVAVEDFKCFACNDDFATRETRAARRKFLVDDVIELLRVLEG